jgi:putative endonuclease
MRLLPFISGWYRRIFPPRSLGYRGERAAERFLRRKGYVILARSQRNKLGEIDLVAVDGRTVVFVEVKTRTSQQKGHPADAVDEDKQRRMTRAAISYLKRNDLLENASRFDVIAVTWSDSSKQPLIEHFLNAFEPTGAGQMFS